MLPADPPAPDTMRSPGLIWLQAHGTSACGRHHPGAMAKSFAPEHTLSCPNLGCEARADCAIISRRPEFPPDPERYPVPRWHRPVG
jgi:hypothetical protein